MYNIIDSENYNFTFCLQIIVLEANLYLLCSIFPNKGYSLKLVHRKDVFFSFHYIPNPCLYGNNEPSNLDLDLNGAFKKNKLTMN